MTDDLPPFKRGGCWGEPADLLAAEPWRAAVARVIGADLAYTLPDPAEVERHARASGRGPTSPLRWVAHVLRHAEATDAATIAAASRVWLAVIELGRDDPERALVEARRRLVERQRAERAVALARSAGNASAAARRHHPLDPIIALILDDLGDDAPPRAVRARLRARADVVDADRTIYRRIQAVKEYRKKSVTPTVVGDVTPGGVWDQWAVTDSEVVTKCRSAL